MALEREDGVLLDVRDLTIRIGGVHPTAVVDGVSLTVRSGEIVGLVGESGSGKTLTAMAVAGLLPPAAEVAGGSIRLAGRDLLTLTSGERRRVLAEQIGVVFQNPTVALNPRLTIGAQVREALPTRYRFRRAAANRRAVELLDLVGIPDAARRLAYYPHELSGGLNQRVVIALAIARGPKLLIADEPTTALDATIQAQVLDLIDRLKGQFGLGVLLVSHDIAVIGDRTDRVAVMHGGRIVEHGRTVPVLAEPEHEQSRRLLAAARSLDVLPPAVAGNPDEPPLLLVDGVQRVFPVVGARRRSPAIRAVDGVSLSVNAGQALGIVGESGSGKTTLARIVVGLDRPSAGRITFGGREPDRLPVAERRLWRRDVQYIFQDPYSALDPRLTVEQIIAEPIELSGTQAERADKRERIGALLDEVGLTQTFRTRYPSQLSGGQRQRVVIARALALGPRLVVADEPVSALDLSVQATILDLLRRLRETRGLTYLVISHDLSVIRSLCSEVIVMTGGRVVESGATAEVFADPSHPYTATLLRSIPGRGVRGIPAGATEPASVS
jgi:peptide/nickel transport system ATP-binding protein